MCSAASLCLTLAFAPLPERGGPVDPAPAVLPAPPAPRGYSGQLFAVDGAVLGVSTLLAAGHQPVPAAALGLGGYLLDGVVVHGLVQGRGRRALGSFALRAGAPLLVGGLGVMVTPCGPPGPDLGSCTRALAGAVVGSFVGAMMAIVLDDVVLAGG